MYMLQSMITANVTNVMANVTSPVCCRTTGGWHLQVAAGSRSPVAQPSRLDVIPFEGAQTCTCYVYFILPTA